MIQPSLVRCWKLSRASTWKGDLQGTFCRAGQWQQLLDDYRKGLDKFIKDQQSLCCNGQREAFCSESET